MKTWIIALAMGIALSAAGASGTFAQAGSTGGTVGKQDKSVSGEQKEQPEERRVAPRRTVSSPSGSIENPHEANSSCGRIVGTWHWFNNVDVVFRANHTAEATNGDTSTWVCDGGMYRVTWRSLGQTDRITIASDGQTLSGVSTLLGIAVSGTRK